MLVLLNFGDKIVCAENVFSFNVDNNHIHITPHICDFHFTQVYYDEEGNENVDIALDMPSIPQNIAELKKGFDFDVIGIEVFCHNTLKELLESSVHFDETTKKPSV